MSQHTRVDYPESASRDRQVVSLAIPQFGALPDDLMLPSPHFVCLLCGDARGVPDRAIIDTALLLLEQGLVYLCAWGPGCNHVRELFEAAALVWNPDAAFLTVHSYDGLDDVMDYFLHVASPSADYQNTCQTGLILTVGVADWSQQVTQYLSTLA